MVVRNTLEGGRRAGYATALGAALPIPPLPSPAGWVCRCCWPLARLGRRHSHRRRGVSRVAGRGSLWRAWRRPDGGIPLSIDPGARPARSHAAAYVGDGLAINLLSPVIISFYLSVVPSFIPAGASRLYYSGLAASHVSLAFLCHAMWATALDAMRRWFVAAVEATRVAGGYRPRFARAGGGRHSLSSRAVPGTSGTLGLGTFDRPPPRSSPRPA